MRRKSIKQIANELGVTDEQFRPTAEKIQKLIDKHSFNIEQVLKGVLELGLPASELAVQCFGIGSYYADNLRMIDYAKYLIEHFTEEKFRLFEEAYNKAVAEKKNDFEFEGHPFLIDCAKYLIEHFKNIFPQTA